MVFLSRRGRAVRDAKALAAQTAQLGLPYAVVLDGVIVAGDETGQKLAALAQESASPASPLTWFDPVGYDRRYRASPHHMTHKEFNGTVWLFHNVTEEQKTLDDLESRVRHHEATNGILTDAMDNIHCPIWVEGENHQIFYHNTYFSRQFEQLPPQSVRDVVREGFTTDGHVRRVVTAIVKGERRQLEVNVQQLPGKRIVAWSPDRTEVLEQIGARDRLLAAQHGLFEQLHTAVAMFDQSETLTFYNSAFAMLWDMEDAWLNTKPKLGDILEKLREQRRLPEQADFRSYKNSWLRLFTELLAPKEDMLYLPDGRTLRLLTVPNPSGGLLMTFEDVTNTLELESSVNTLLAVQRETLDNMTEAMAVFGPDGRLKLWNQQYGRMWGLFPEDLDGTPHISTLVGDMSKNFAKDIQKKMENVLMAQALDRQERKARFVFADGRQINNMAVPLPDGATLVAYDDVTDAYQVEQALRDKATALEAAEQLKLDFLANVSYQLRTPLNAIIGFSELLEHQYFGVLNERQLDYAKGITEAGQRLLSLVDDILDLSTIEAGYLEITKDVVDISSMVGGVYHLTEEWARKSQHHFTLNLDGDLHTIEGDERRLKQALLNLIRNAIAFTPRGGSIEVGALRDDGHMRIWVKDNGVGISPEDQTRIFNAFERVEESGVNQRTGAGLGLSLVKSIVDLHGGRIELDSTLGVGTTITMTLPTGN